MHQKNTISNSLLHPNNLLVERQTNAVGWNSKRCSLLVQQFAICVREYGKWAAVAAGIEKNYYGTKSYVSSSSRQCRSLHLSHQCFIYVIRVQYGIYCICCWCFWCVADKNTFTQIYYIWYQNENIYIGIASPSYYEKRKKEFHVEILLCHATNNL